MQQYLYQIRPKRTQMLIDGGTPEESALVGQHFTYLQQLSASGTVLLAGRTLNTDESSFGIVIFEAESDETAQAVVDADPAVKGGVFSAELFPTELRSHRSLHEIHPNARSHHSLSFSTSSNRRANQLIMLLRRGEKMNSRQRQLTRFERLLENFAATRLGGWLFVNVFPHIDRPLMKLSGGRLNTGFGQPIGIVSNIGARSGLKRETPLLCTPDGDNWLIVASKAGAEKHPAWYYNLKANPEVTLFLRRKTYPCIAEEVTGEERADAWAKVVDFYRGYGIYQERAGEREIPIFRLVQVAT